MIRTGDWIVPRQQGEVFIDRPPMSSWSMAAVGTLRGKVDMLAIRLPSVISILLTSLLIYGYCRTFLTPTGAMAAGAAFASMLQVLQLGRMGENEALYTLFVCGAMLGWHALYVRGKSRALAWSLGYALAGLAALQKGIQGPVYFVAAVGMFLVLKRDWRWLFSWGHLAGLLCLAAVIGAWWVPFYFATNWDTAVSIWTATVTRRFASSGILNHVLTYPFETFGCLLPWSVLLSGVVWPSVRRTLGRPPQQIIFAASAIVLPYSMLLVASNAKGRYFMPLYPMIAVAIGWFVERCAACDPALLPRKRWNLFLILITFTGMVGAIGLLVASLLPHPTGMVADARQPLWVCGMVLAAAIAFGGIMLWARRTSGSPAVEIGTLAVVCLLGLAYTGPVMNVFERRANDMALPVAEFKHLVPTAENIVSLGPIHHRFAWYYGAPIKRLAWPMKPADLPPDVTYFYMEWSYGDTPEWRSMGPGLFDPPTPGTLPFKWEKIAFLSCDPDQNNNPHSGVILGRVIREDQAAINSKPKDRALQ